MAEVWAAAMALLARREHGAVELADKLTKQGFAKSEVASALVACQNLGLQSDQRFVEMLVRTRVRQGYGPERIRQELTYKQVEPEYFTYAVAQDPVDWLLCAKRVLDKKYHSSEPATWLMQQKQKKFLLYRGFSSQLIAQLFKMDEETTP